MAAFLFGLSIQMAPLACLYVPRIDGVLVYKNIDYIAQCSRD